jgi:hypothetical protein
MSRQANPRVRNSSPKGIPSGPAAAGGARVKITDMLGEEVLTLHTV